MIKSLPKEENPREKALVYGIESLSNVELLALVLRTGNKDESVIELSQRLLKEIGGFSQLLNVNYATLVSLKGIKSAKAIEILSIIEISKRIKKKDGMDIKILNPKDVYHYVKDELMLLKQESFLLICLDSKNHVIKKKVIFVGTIDSSVVTPREIFKEAISVSSSKIILCHNHPSGVCQPSQEDIVLTRQFQKLGEMMAIEVIDHIIIGWNEFFSMKQAQVFQVNS